MIVYKDKLTGDEIVSDNYPQKKSDVEALFEVDLQMVTVGAENITLAGANPSAEEAEEGNDEGEAKRVLDIADQFRLIHMEGKPSKKAAGAEIKKYLKALSDHIKEKDGEEAMKKFQASAAPAAKKIIGNWDNYDVYTGESMAEPCMWVLVDYREDGVTPFASIWSAGLDEVKY